MKKLTARNSTFLHNAKLMFGAPAYKRILAAAQHSEGQAWNVAREYISLDGSEATRKVMFSERYADLDTMFRAIKAEFSAEPAAIAANVSADAAPAWTPKPGDIVRFKRGVQLSGDNRDVDAIQGMGVVGKIVRRCAEVGYEWTVSFGLDGDYNAATDELEPASTPAPDAAQTAAAGTVTVASIQAALDAIEWTDADSGSGIFAKVEQLSDGIGCEWFFNDTGRFLDFEGLGKTPEDAMRKVKTMIDTDDRKVDPRDAEKAALERELEAVKQMFDGYQTAARETEQALTRDLEAARTEAAALREALAEMPKYRLGQEVSVGEYSPAIGKVEEIRITDDGIDYSVYVEGESMAYTWSEGKVSPADPDAELATARQRADSDPATWLTAADVRAQSEFAEED